MKKKLLILFLLFVAKSLPQFSQRYLSVFSQISAYRKLSFGNTHSRKYKQCIPLSLDSNCLHLCALPSSRSKQLLLMQLQQDFLISFLTLRAWFSSITASITSPYRHAFNPQNADIGIAPLLFQKPL